MWKYSRVHTYQSSAAKQDHEDDEGLKPVVLHNEIAGLSQEPPVFAPAKCDGHVTARVTRNAT